MAKKFISLTLLQSYDVKIKNFVNSLITAANGDITALQSAIDLLNGDAEGSVNAKITAAFNDFSTKVSDDNVVNSYKELIDWAASHGSEAAEMAGAITALQAAVGKPADGENAATGLYKAVADAQAAAIASANGYTDTQVGAEETRAKGVEEGLDGRIEALENKFSGEGSVESQIATAKSEAIAAAATDAEGKVNTLSGTAVSSTSGTDIKVDLGGTVGAPTVTVTYEFAEEQDIVDMFAPKGE